MNDPVPPSLLSIIALARSGALDRAIRLFREGGFEAVTDDPATLSVHGRLLKDQARSASGAARTQLWKAAGDAYARAGDLSGATYHLINAATLALLAGDRAQAEARAERVLEKLDAGETGPETPYYLEATRAEALLLLGRTEEAKTALDDACRIAPRAWEDHASTLRQFRLILDLSGEDAGWLTRLQPPASLHFAGHLAVTDEAPLRDSVDAALADNRVGFAYGALAGGADVIVAERVLAAGSELHLILPAPAAVFRADSAEPLGDDWAARFDAVLERAESVSVIEPRLTTTTLLQVRLAAEVAMGRAVMKAAALASDVLQLLLVDPEAATSVTARIGAQWRAAGRAQVQLEISRTAAARQGRPLSDGPDDGVLAAMLAMSFDGEDWDSDLAGSLTRIVDSLADVAPPLTTPVIAGDALHLAFSNPAEAADAADALTRAFRSQPPRIAGHYGVARRTHAPFGDQAALVGSATGLAPGLLASTPAGAVHVTDTFAAALYGWSRLSGDECAYIGDLPRPEGAIPLYALTRTAA